MENAIKHLRIQNFKSIKDVTLKPRRVNIIIGEPNVGKSNILEAMSLLGGIVYEQTDKFMGSFIRYEEPRQLFYDNLVANTIKVETDKEVALLMFENRVREFQHLFCDLDLYLDLADTSIFDSGDTRMTNANKIVGEKEAVIMSVVSQKEFIERLKLPAVSRFAYTNFKNQPSSNYDKSEVREIFNFDSPATRLYAFNGNDFINYDLGDYYLMPPSGNNLIEVIQSSSKLRREIARMFERYDQKLQVRMDKRHLEVVKDKDGITYAYPYSSIADTLQRLIFYLAAIESNDDTVLLFEEPEAHSFPVYVSKLGRHIVESRNNQFFIVTHSEYLVTEILEEMLTKDEYAGELAIFAAYYEDYQTKVHQLSDEEIFDIRADGIDVFYNMKRFTTGRENA